MPTKSKLKPPPKRKRATPIRFNDDKVDSIVKEITENLNSDLPEATLEEEVKAKVEERLAAESGKNEEPEAKEDLVVEEKVLEESKEDEGGDEDDEAKGDEEKAADTEEGVEEGEKNDDTEEGSSAFAPEKNDNPFPPLEDEPKRSFKWPIIYFVLFLAGMGTGFVIFDQLTSRGGDNFFSMTAPTPTTAPSPTAMPTPEVVDFSEYEITVQNGSGISGEAGRLRDQLEEAKFTVTDVGNADNSNYDETVIKIKNGTNTSFLEALRTELEKTYVVAKETEDLAEDEEGDAVIVIGSEKAAGDEKSP